MRTFSASLVAFGEQLNLKKHATRLAFALSLTALAPGAWAAPVNLIDPTTRNGSFELPATGKQQFGFDGASTGNAADDQDVPFWNNIGGPAQASSGTETTGGAQNGTRVAFFVSQDPGAFNLTTYSIQEGDQFSLSYYLRTGNQSDAFVGRLFSSTDGTFATASTLATVSTSLVNGSFEATPVTLTYTATAADAGKTIGVSLDNAHSGNFSYVDVDNVVLSVTSVPEPSACLVLLGGLGALLRRRRVA
jgi:hypothetical protein